MITEMHGFGRYLRQLRKDRGLTQEGFAERAYLSTDAIRRIEIGRMSPTLITLRKLCHGLGISLSTMFDGMELGEHNRSAELLDLMRGRPDADVVLATRLVRVVFDGVNDGFLDEDD
jgi:transcriptional regulator with XRE-family HTH domain